MHHKPVNQIVIVGGGTAGWMTAASMARYFQGKEEARITLIESAEIGTVGVGEATIPSIRDYNRSLGIDELDFIQSTQATFKLGIEFKDWQEKGRSFFHPFADYGINLNGIDFHHYLSRIRAAGDNVDIADYCFAIQLAKKGNFAQPHEKPPSPLADFSYAYHFDAALYANYLRDYATARGVQRREGKITDVQLNPSTGYIESVTTEDGQNIGAQLFIDCSGFRGLLIEQALKTGYEDWRQWLPCDRAVALQSESDGELTPYTLTTAREAGWQWRIPLQHRTGNGYVYASEFVSDAQAEATLLENLDAAPTNKPRGFQFSAGRRQKIWNKNCFALGLSSGFLEPLESTSISLIQTGITQLLQFFPDSGFNPYDQAEVNRLHRHELERIRDFLVLHYKATSRSDTEFWRYCQSMPIPETLAHKMALFESRGHLVMHEPEAFEKDSWLAMYMGFQKYPQRYDPRADSMPLTDLKETLNRMRNMIQTAAEQAISHRAFIDRHCLNN